MEIASMHSWVVEFCCKGVQEQGATAGRGEWWLGKDVRWGMEYACARVSTWVHAGCDPGEGLGPRAQVGPPVRRKGERGVCGWVTGGVSGRFLPSFSAKREVRSAAERGWGRCWASGEVGNPKWGLSRAGRFTPRTFTACPGRRGAGRCPHGV